MKTFKFLLIILFFVGCEKSDPEMIDEVPDQIVSTSTCPSIYSTFLEILPSFQNNKEIQPYFFNDTTLKKIVIAKATKVYLTFINENADAHNTIGWYTYNEANLPTKESDIKKHILFPNASLQGSGGGLSTGDMMQLDTTKFVAGSVIGFFLVVNGWQNGNIDYSQPIFYTDYLLNDKQDQQHVFYNDTSCKAIILSWEDTPLYLPSDSDFNDIVFMASDNKEGLETKSFNLKGIVVK